MGFRLSANESLAAPDNRLGVQKYLNDIKLLFCKSDTVDVMSAMSGHGMDAMK